MSPLSHRFTYLEGGAPEGVSKLSAIVLFVVLELVLGFLHSKFLRNLHMLFRRRGRQRERGRFSRVLRHLLLRRSFLSLYIAKRSVAGAPPSSTLIKVS